MLESTDPSPPTNPTPATLDYAPASPRRRRLRRWLGFFLVVSAVGCAGWRWGPAAWERTKYLYCQHQCMTYSPSPELIVYEEDPVAALSLAARDAQYAITQMFRLDHGDTGWNAFAATYTPPPWVTFDCLGKGKRLTPPTAGATAFLHELTSPAGHHRLVLVIYHPPLTEFIPGLTYTGLAITPATFNKPSPVATLHRYPYDVVLEPMICAPRIRMYAGQPDAEDPAHFTIRYEMWGQTDTLDGTLDDQDNVTLTPRHLPTQPAPVNIGGRP